MQACRFPHSALSRHAHGTAATPPHCVIELTVDAQAITALRQLVMRFCGEAMEFMRVAVRADTGRARVWLCVQASMARAVMDLVLRSLPAAQFGRSGDPGAQPAQPSGSTNRLRRPSRAA